MWSIRFPAQPVFCCHELMVSYDKHEQFLRGRVPVPQPTIDSIVILEKGSLQFRTWESQTSKSIAVNSSRLGITANQFVLKQNVLFIISTCCRRDFFILQTLFRA